jgi:hypothetical protein
LKDRTKTSKKKSFGIKINKPKAERAVNGTAEKNGNSPAVKKFIQENADLFWYVRNDAKENINKELLTETILNWGDLKSVSKLFTLLGLKEVADIFYKNTSGARTNYRKKVINYFNLYFEKHSHRNPYRRSKGVIAAHKAFF